MQNLILVLLILGFMTSVAQEPKSLYDFKMQTIDGEEYDFSQLKGKKVLIVNVASKCGLTPQYEQLQQLYKKWGGDSFTILGFPANNFAGQEPGSHEEIKQFCTKNYGVTFQIFEKISVKGKKIHPLYQWLTQKDLNGQIDAKVTWNFQKFLIDEDGTIFKSVEPKVEPLNYVITDWIKRQK
ncbi:MAG: glutathione peroxidase [Bacteroidetes bacterium]|nr:glutathione peroxidase [Bacteroidia bacterium]MBL4715963.1 glutathione peroxidase [Bacteroidia bacterium]PCH69274.1 MAG: glutathione peroxidase [Bacteroidota bacterium]